MKKPVLAALALILCATLTVASAGDPIWVDGDGIGNDHIITENQANQNQNNNNNNNTNNNTDHNNAYATATPIPQNNNPSIPNNGVNFITPAPDEPAATGDPTRWQYDASAFYAEWQGQTCEVIALGQYTSTIKTKEGTVEVFTRDLQWETTADENHRLAIVNAPSSGYARMRKVAKSTSTIIMRCQTGRVVPVYSLTKNKKWAQVHYADATGYVLASALTFVPMGEGGVEAGYIAYKGNAKSGEKIKVRQKANQGSRVLDELPCGQRVTILGTDDKWTNIEAGNLQCWILSSFMTTLTEEQAEALPRRGTTAKTFLTTDAYATKLSDPLAADPVHTPEPPLPAEDGEDGEEALPDITPAPQQTEPPAEAAAEDQLNVSAGYGAD